eukprot:Transcript_323.p2 GENE.Transcript_323~~Transcript_323.p2  ORF type:complete len:346 (-),score=96.98 Transcript_323:1000-2037(-)
MASARSSAMLRMRTARCFSSLDAHLCPCPATRIGLPAWLRDGVGGALGTRAPPPAAPAPRDERRLLDSSLRGGGGRGGGAAYALLRRRMCRWMAAAAVMWSWRPGGGGGGGPPGGGALAAPWAPTPCGCRAVREGFFSEDKYGGYRPIAWLLRTFFDAFRNASALPPQIVWPAGAQFSAARLAVRSKPPAFWRALLGLASPPAPLKRDVPRQPGASDQAHHKAAKWANFGPVVVDLGPLGKGADGNRAGINGMDFAQACERSWFRIFDPALKVTMPPFAKCYTAEALALSPVRCGTGQCPSTPARQRPGGCELTDRQGLSRPPQHWRYAEGKNRCMSDGCMPPRS